MIAAPPPQEQAAPPAEFIPHEPTRAQRLLALLIHWLVRGVTATLRIRWERDPRSVDIEGGPYIFCTWHNRLVLALHMYARYRRAHGRRSHLAGIVSASRDGALMSRVLELAGVEMVRGSSSRRGLQAMLELAELSSKGRDIAVTTDGPRGPRYVSKAGIISLARMTGRPVLPACYHVQWKITLRNWDRFQIPLPFSRVTYSVGEPLSVPRHCTEDERESLRAELDRRLLALTRD